MKKLLSLLLALLLLPLGSIAVTAAAPPPVSAREETIEILDDGSYFTVGTTAPIVKESADGFLMRLMSLLKKIIRFFRGIKNDVKEIEAEKYISYYDSKGVKLWTVTLTASFRYNGIAAECRSASLKQEMYDRDWQMVSSACEKDTDRVQASFTVRQTKLGVRLKTIEKTITIVCAANGTLT